MKKKILLTASFLGAISVLIGAMGAHVFEDYLISVDRDQTFEIAVRYQFYHVFFQTHDNYVPAYRTESLSGRKWTSPLIKAVS